jgi:hypothetical protein
MNKLYFFTSNTYHFETSSLLALKQNLHPSDREDFDIDTSELNYEDYFERSYIGFRRYLLNEAPYTTPQAWRHFRR